MSCLVRQKLEQRADFLATIRLFFQSRGVLPVETPIFSPTATPDPALTSFQTVDHAVGVPLYLHTSPEFFMKRLLAAGSGSIYQICKVFRCEEQGRYHQPEFTMLEWYRVGWDHWQLMEEVAQLAQICLEKTLQPTEWLSYQQAFQYYVGVDPFQATLADLAKQAEPLGLAYGHATLTRRDEWLDLLLSHFIAPHLGKGRLTFLHSYPPSQAALARINQREELPVAERFELYLSGIELANGFHELTDPKEQRERFEEQNLMRLRLGKPSMPIDELFLESLNHMPDCAGVALGIDRLFMLRQNQTNLDPGFFL